MGIIASTHQGIKKGSTHLGVLSLRFFSALIVAYAMALIGEGLLFYGRLSFWFVLIITAAVFLKITRSWGAGGVLVLDLILFLIGLLLRMYVLVAPGA
ncbi:MAG: hypothetical protein KDD37_10225 [Bdellovibrionales bacterium]|nr:hypothetical protein [Bdellovibrionales bacterium]